MITPARNPMGLNGCKFIELASPSSGVLIPAFKRLDPTSMAPLTDEDKEMLEGCLPEHEGRGEVLALRATIVDGSAPVGDPQRLRPIFSATPVGPPYFECTQRNRHKRVGESNVKVLLQSLDPVQVRSDVIGMS